MDPFCSPYIIPDSSPHNPFPHSLLRARKFRGPGFRGLGFSVPTDLPSVFEGLVALL